MCLEFCISRTTSKSMDITPTFKHDISIIMPDTWSSIVRSKVRKEIFQSVCIRLKCILYWLNRVINIATITIDNVTEIIKQINTCNFGIIKLWKRPPNIRSCVNCFLRIIKFKQLCSHGWCWLVELIR